MRNFDPVDFKPTNYVNGVRYTYTVLQTSVNPDYFDAVELQVDPTQPYFTTAASIVDGVTVNGVGVSLGEYFSNLTRDDVGGLRYLYNPANLNVETHPANTQQLITDTSTVIQFTNFDLALFSSLSSTSTPAQLLANTNFPGLIIDRTNASAVAVTNIIVTFTNIGSFFTNRDNLTIVTNQDLFAFSSQSLTSPPATLLALYPGLIFTSTNVSVTNLTQISSVTTNLGTSPWGAPGSLRPILVTNYVTNLTFIYHYTFANVLTNFNSASYSPSTLVDLQTLELDLAPYGDPLAPFRTNVIHKSYVTNLPSGNIIILPTNTKDYVLLDGTLLSENPPVGIINVFSVTNNIIPPLTFGTLGVIFQQDAVYRYTNTQFAAYPVELTTATSLVPVTTTNITVIPVFNDTFLNVRTNHVFTSAPVQVETLQILNDPRPGFPRITNLISTTSYVSNFINGDFDILPPNGYPPVVLATTNIIPVTNILADVINPITGEEDQQIVVYNFMQVISAVNPFVLQAANPNDFAPGVDLLHFKRADFNSLIGQGFLYTNTYAKITITNSTPFTNTFQIIKTGPDILFAAADLGDNAPAEVPPLLARSDTTSWINDQLINTGSPLNPLAGPGIIPGGAVITFNKVGPSLTNIQPGSDSEETARESSFSFFGIGGVNFIWGSFDGSTKTPIVYPEDVSLQDIENLILHPR
jgi:hypothetical protein